MARGPFAAEVLLALEDCCTLISIHCQQQQQQQQQHAVAVCGMILVEGWGRVVISVNTLPVVPGSN